MDLDDPAIQNAAQNEDDPYQMNNPGALAGSDPKKRRKRVKK